MKKFMLLFLIMSVFTVYAKDNVFDLKTGEDTVTINLKTKDFQSAQLFRKANGKSAVNIFEFSSLENSFTEQANSENCYFVKVYKNSETPVVSKEKCVPETYFVGVIESTLVVFLLLLIFSFFAPGFIPFRFLAVATETPEDAITETVEILAGEDSKNVLIHSSSDWIGDPVNTAVNSFLKRSLKKDQENILTTFYDKTTFSRTGAHRLMKKLPLINGQRPFLTDVLRRDVPRSAVFHITENNPESALDSFKDRKDKRKMIFSQSLSGAVTDLIFKRKALVSIEALAFNSKKKEEKVLDHSGAYLFLMVVASAVLLGSVLKTIGAEDLIDNLIFLVTGGRW